jgi:hypothetical protein
MLSKASLIPFSLKCKMEGWRARTLSQASKTVLIKVVAAAMPSYAMNTFLLPKRFYRKLDQLFKNFWWGFHPKKNRNLSLKSWHYLCSPKASEALRFRKMEDVNLALISKLGWKLLSHSDSLWVIQLQGKYILSGSFLSPPPPHSTPSWLWKGILFSLPAVSQGACYRVHIHSSIPIWNSPWIPTLPSFSVSPSYPRPPNSTNLVISDLINPNATWNTPLFRVCLIGIVLGRSKK